MAQSTISNNLVQLGCRIHDACLKYGRDPAGVRLLAVSKTMAEDRIADAIAAGQHDFGENYLQEALPKIHNVNDPAVIWHYIGAIQSNKTRDIAGQFAWVHTVSRLRIAARLSAQRPHHLPPLKVLVQVNVSGESTKEGVDPDAAANLVGDMLTLPRLEIAGLMTIGAAGADFTRQREAFRRLAGLRAAIAARYGDDLPGFTELSMGMSADMEAAIAEGATWLRIGTAIFGPRTQQQTTRETL